MEYNVQHGFAHTAAIIRIAHVDAVRCVCVIAQTRPWAALLVPACGDLEFLRVNSIFVRNLKTGIFVNTTCDPFYKRFM